MKAKRLVSLLMAMALVVGIFAVPAMAANATDDGIEPYGLVISCPRCGKTCNVRERAIKTNKYIMVTCGSGGQKKHYLYNLQKCEDCPSCGYHRDWYTWNTEYRCDC